MGKVANVVFTVGGIASGAKGLLDIVRGATPGQTILAGKHLIVETKKIQLVSQCHHPTFSPLILKLCSVKSDYYVQYILVSHWLITL